MRHCGQITVDICARLHEDRFTIPYPSRSTATQRTTMNTIRSVTSSSSDKNGAIYHRKDSRQTKRKYLGSISMVRRILKRIVILCDLFLSL